MTVTSGFQFAGSIVRIRLINFMTYDDVSMHPGPNLNMILGPNGTGKSAFVCCMIVGLAGEVTLTGRGTSPADFVKKHRPWGSTEIELCGERGSNYIVLRKITITSSNQYKLEHKSEWSINGVTVKKCEVLALTKKLNIKVDNLCQFLPQDSVTQFVKMKETELLLSTLKAAGDNKLVDDHRELVDLTKDYEFKKAQLSQLRDSLKEIEVNTRRLKNEVNMLEEREKLVKMKDICEQKVYYLNYQKAKKLYDDAMKEFKVLQENLDKYNDNIAPFKIAVEEHMAETNKYNKAQNSSSNEITKTLETVETLTSKIRGKKSEISREFNAFKVQEQLEIERSSNIATKRQDLQARECRLIEIRDVDLTRDMQRAQARVTELHSNQVRLFGQNEEIKSSSRLKQEERHRTSNELDSIVKLKEKKYQLLRSKHPEIYRVTEWITSNRAKFKAQVFNPLMCEINVKDPKYCSVVEHAIPNQELIAFLCQTPEDVVTLTTHAREELRVKPNVILVPSLTIDELVSQSNLNHEALKASGVKAQLIDLIDAPEPVMLHLCGSNNFHRIPVADSCSETQLQTLLNLSVRFFVGNTAYVVSKSRYDGKSITTSDNVRDAQYLRLSINTKKLKSCEQAMARLNSEIDQLRAQSENCVLNLDEVKANWQRESEALKEMSRKNNERKTLEKQIENIRKSLESLENDRIDIDAEREKLQSSVESINSDIYNFLRKLTINLEALVEVKQAHMCNLLLARVAASNVRIAEKKYKEAKRETHRLKEEIAKKESDTREKRSTADSKKREAEEKIGGFEDGKLKRTTKKDFDDLKENTIDELINKREELQVMIHRIYHDKNNTILNDYNRQLEELQDKKTRAVKLEELVLKVDKQREKIKKRWKPNLDEVIKLIDGHYQEFMHKLSYDGRVKLAYDVDDPNNFSVYGISIQVKYRDNEALIPLSSTRQSGGERSVATMVYMLALQAKTTVPFRCVDEINQGMDKDNERRVFELLVKTADSSSSQYFLVSPKLLSDLPYSEKMKIHIIFNGKSIDGVL